MTYIVLAEQQHQALLRRCTELAVLATALGDNGEKLAAKFIDNQIRAIKLTLEQGKTNGDLLEELASFLHEKTFGPPPSEDARKLLAEMNRLFLRSVEKKA